MKQFRKGIAVLAATAVLLCGTLGVSGASVAKQPKVSIDGQAISVASTYGTPFIDSGNRLMVPVRILSEKLGAQVVWNQATQTATINGDVAIKVGEASIKVGKETVAMDTRAVQKSNRLYVPIRFIGNALGYKVVSSTSGGVLTANVVTKAELTVSAAASLKDAMNEIKGLYAKARPNTAITLNFGASGSLAQQIEQGADVDLFFSASTANMDSLKGKGLLDNNTVKNLLGNKLVLIVPKGSTLSLKGFADLTGASVKKVALGEPKTVPAGQYAEDVFTKLGVLDKVKVKAVYGKDVKEVLTWVETGNVDAGVVYSTDAKVSSKVKVMATAPDNSHKPIVYPVGAVKGSDSIDATKAFIRFLESDTAKAVFEKYGFNTL